MLKQSLDENGTALHEEMRQTAELKTANEQLANQILQQKEAYAKLDKHAKNCEKATNKAQKEAKHTQGYADHLIGSQKGNLKSAERRLDEATRELKQWRDKYGWSVEKPAEEKYALQERLSEWQSKAEKARNQIVSLEEQIQGTPQQIGLHQALEEWEEHQGCSAEFADLQDKLHDGTLLKQQLESDLASSKQRYQKTKSDMKALQTKADQLEQAYKALQNQDKTNEYILHIQKLESDLEQYQKTEGDVKALQEKVNQLESASEVVRGQEKTDTDMLDADMLDKERLESDLKALQDRLQKTESEMKALHEKADLLEQANKAFQDQAKSDNDTLQKLESDQKASEEQCQETDSSMKALREQADQLKSELNVTKEQLQTTESDMEALQGKTDQLESDLNSKEEQLDELASNMESLQGILDQLESDLKRANEERRTTKSNMDELGEQADQLKSELNVTKEQLQTKESDMETLQGKADQLESDLNFKEEQLDELVSNMESLQGILDQLESDLKRANEERRTTKSNMDELREKTVQLEQANQAFQQKEDENLLSMTFEREEQNLEPVNKEIWAAVQQDIEGRRKLLAQNKASKKPHQDLKTQQLRIETPKEAEPSQITPPSSPIYTTDDGSQDLEKTPRPKKSLRQDLGYSSRDQSDEEQSDFSTPQQQGVMTSKQAEIGEEEREAGAETWETDDSQDGEEHTKGSTHREMKKPLPMKRQATNLETVEIRAKERAKEQSEALETLFECTPAKANAIDRRLKALGPGCRLHEAPALVAYELSGIPEDTYKGLASGQLIATMPPNEVKDVGTNPDRFADDMATDTTGLLTKEVASPLSVAKDMATDTTDLPVEEATAPYTKSSRRALFLCFLMLLTISSGLFCMYMGLRSDPKPNTQHGIMYKNIYSHRHTPFPTPSRCAPTPITFVYPPTPALQLGLERMMTGSSLGGGLKGMKW
ncbi:MAG: hypothetical protein ASARMPRED_000145 [Alectoria sarmentosa]|nr:MAG: hypothetical protein ASARMPRED_000145 [Alectoria sarmentosa]